VVNAIDPIAVDRVNPGRFQDRHDEGWIALARHLGIDFPQTTRTPVLTARPQQHRHQAGQEAGVPVLPLALKTDAWGNGSLIKDYGSTAGTPRALRFGDPIRIRGAARTSTRMSWSFVHCNSKPESK
jgi:1-acyl-sn-glycerol-3-phosphate acyltransferase